MLKHKKLIIILIAVIFFITAVTFYVNRVVFPQLVRKIAIEQAEAFLKRKVEIGSIRFSWVKGFLIDTIKVYQKDSTTDVFAQAESVSFGIIVIPSFKQHKITIPFINVNHPSAHLIRVDTSTWNFSDLLNTPAPPATDKPLPFSIALGAINITDGKLRVDDASKEKPWRELFDAINLKMSLSLKGITYDFTTTIPERQGYLSAKGSYQPLTQDLHTAIELKNIDTSSYLSLVAIPNLRINSGLIKKIDLTLDYSKTKITALGNISVSNLDLIYNDQQLKSNIEITDLDALFTTNGPIKAKAAFNLIGVAVTTPTIQASGNFKGQISDLSLDKDNINFEGSITADSANIALAPDQTIKGQLTLDDIKIRKDKDGAQLVGALVARSLEVQWLKQSLKGDISIKPLTLRMSDENHIEAQGDLKAENLLASLDADKTFSGNIIAQELQLSLTNKKDITLSTKLNIEDMNIAVSPSLKASGTVKVTKLLLKLVDDLLKVSTETEITNGHLDLGDNKIIDASPRTELSLQLPLKDPASLTYEGSITVSDAHVSGFPMTELVKSIELDANFTTDAATINALTVNVLDTDLRASGTVNDFKNPLVSINAEANDLNLARIKEIIPAIIKEYGLDISGVASLKVKFDGLVLKPLEGKILAVASLKKVDVTSSKFNQTVQQITGVVEVTPDSLKWRDFTATYLDQEYTLTGGLTDFKNPKITTSLDGEQVQLKADITKTGDLVNIALLKGKYLNIGFNTTGNITLASGEQPLLDINTKVHFNIDDILGFIPEEQRKSIVALNPTGDINVDADIKGPAQDWKNWTLKANVSSPLISVMNYKLNNVQINVIESDQKVKNLTVDGLLYDGKVHAVSSVDLTNDSMPFELALNIDEVDMRKFKMDSPLKTEEVNGKFYLTTIASGTIADIKNLHGKGSFAIREGFLTEFKIFKGLLGTLNEALRLGQVMITDVESNFTINDQKISTDNLRLKSPTLVLLGEGWVNFDQDCDLKMIIDMSSGIVPPIAEEVLRTLNIHIHGKITDPKFDKKISVPQVINSILKTLF